MREGLREISEELALRPEFFRVEAYVVGISEHLLENKPGFQRVASPGQAFRKPKGADTESPFLTWQAIGSGFANAVAVHERILHQNILNAFQRGKPKGVTWRNEFDQGHEK